MSDGGKGSAPRPYSVDRETFAANWERVFGKGARPAVPADLPKDQPAQQLTPQSAIKCHGEG